MADAKTTEVYCKVKIKVADGEDGTYIPKGSAVQMSDKEIDQFGKAVTKDVPKGAKKVKRA